MTQPGAMPQITLVGFPFRSTGRGEHLRAIWRALETVGVTASIVDLDAAPPPHDAAVRRFAEHAVPSLAPGIRLFHLNGNEVRRTLAAFVDGQPRVFTAGHNIVFPAWELPRYPVRWARLLDRFDEVWTASAFVDAAIRAAVSVPVFKIPNACEPHVETVSGRDDFGLPADRYLVLYSFDLRSYFARKNPLAAIEAFRRLVQARPSASAHLVLKINGGDFDPDVIRILREAIADFGDRVSVIDRDMALDEARSLIRCADCCLSLHRSEGFGRGPAEAMFFGKPVVATGWSGNMEYMNPNVVFPVGYRLVPVKDGEYIKSTGQVWAEPDVAEAAEVLVRLIDNPELGQAIGERARRHMAQSFSDHVLGHRYLERFAAIVEARITTHPAA